MKAQVYNEFKIKSAKSSQVWWNHKSLESSQVLNEFTKLEVHKAIMSSQVCNKSEVSDEFTSL